MCCFIASYNDNIFFRIYLLRHSSLQRLGDGAWCSLSVSHGIVQLLHCVCHHDDVQEPASSRRDGDLILCTECGIEVGQAHSANHLSPRDAAHWLCGAGDPWLSAHCTRRATTILEHAHDLCLDIAGAAEPAAVGAARSDGASGLVSSARAQRRALQRRQLMGLGHRLISRRLCLRLRAQVLSSR